jgi:hypothetical protein
MKRLILIATLTLLAAAPAGAARTRQTARWCGRFSVVKGSATSEYKLQVRNLACTNGRTLAVGALSTGTSPQGFKCSSTQLLLGCWTRKHYRWFQAFLLRTSGSANPPQTAPPPSPPSAPSNPPSSPTSPRGSRSNPFPIGTMAGDTQWAVRVNSVNLDAWPAVAAANQFNVPPPAGWVDVLANITGKYMGQGQGDVMFSFLMTLGVAGNDGVVIHSWDHSCGVPPHPNDLDFSTVSSGASFTLNECWQVPSSAVSSLELYYKNTDTNRSGWFALH